MPSASTSAPTLGANPTSAQPTTACGIRLDATREGDIELDRVRPEVEDVAKARVSRARVVDRESYASCAHGGQRGSEALVVEHRCVLRDLQHEPVSRHDVEQLRKLR
jgi:hypothetical protein